MANYGIIYLNKDHLYTLNINLKKGKIFVEKFEEETLPEEVFKITPFGLFPSDSKLISEKLEPFIALNKIKNWSLVLPDFWQKTLILEEENIPKNSKEIKSFIEWHFKKSYNLKPEEIRFSFILLNDKKNKLLVNFALERTLSILEQIFKNQKKHLGQIVSSFWSLYYAIPKKGSFALLNLENDTWTLGIFENSNIISLRQRIIPKGNLNILIEEIERTINLNRANLNYFYLNSFNLEMGIENLSLPFNVFEIDFNNVEILCEVPDYFKKIKNYFLGTVYGLP